MKRWHLNSVCVCMYIYIYIFLCLCVILLLQLLRFGSRQMDASSREPIGYIDYLCSSQFVKGGGRRCLGSGASVWMLTVLVTVAVAVAEI